MSLETGKSYNLLELMTENNRKIVIPDLQRDYCWGDATHGKEKSELVGDFLNNLIENFQENPEKKLQMGMLYAYEFPKNSNHFHLCDGQQRMTTLFLILGMIHKKTPRSELKNCLISDFELNKDDQEPRLQYAIRESTLYFLSDLVCQFFLKNASQKVAEITKQKWYFSAYNLDPTIQSILAALATIEKIFNDFSPTIAFANFLLNSIKFFYFDMMTREKGEDMFVTINTTGEPLTATENLKPILLGNIKDEENRKKLSNRWEEWENWFWKNRTKGEHEADPFFTEFMKWFWQIEKQQKEVNPRKLFGEKKEEIEEQLSKIDTYFLGFQYLVEIVLIENLSVLESIPSSKNNSPAATFIRSLPEDVLLPLLIFLIKFPDNNPALFIRRLRKNHFDGIWKHRNNNYMDWRYLVQIIQGANCQNDILEGKSGQPFSPIPNVSSHVGNWYNAEERWKTKLRETYPKKVAEWEDHEDFMGDLTPLMEVSEANEDVDILNAYFETYKKIRIEKYHFSENKELHNRYLLNDLLMRGRWEGRSIAGEGYCMWVKCEELIFLQERFFKIWQKFNNQNEIILYLKNELKEHFESLNLLENLETSLRNVPKDGFQINLIKIWLVLELLNEKDEKLPFTKYNISCYWNIDKQLIKTNDSIDNDSNDYSIGNIFLGTSYYNNKSGKMYNDFPLMKELMGTENTVFSPQEQTDKYLKLLEKEFFEKSEEL